MTKKTTNKFIRAGLALAGFAALQPTAIADAKAKPTQHDLRETLDGLLDGKPPAKRITKAVGCYIDFSNDKKDNK